MHGLHAVQRNAHIGKPYGLEFAGLGLGDERAVGGDDRPHALGRGVAGQLHQVFAHQGLTAGKKHDRRAVGGQIVDHGLGLGGADLVLAVHGHGLGIAVHALEVAALGHVPDHNGFFILGKLQQMGGQLARLPPVAQGVGGFHLAAVEFGDADHGVYVLMRPAGAGVTGRTRLPGLRAWCRRPGPCPGVRRPNRRTGPRLP